jgi:uncharacterized protein
MLKAAGVAFAVLVALASALIIWGAAIEPRLILDERSETAPIPGLPPAWEGKEIALVGDFQIGMWLDNAGMVEHAVTEIASRRPALVLLTGDFVYGPIDEEADDFREEYAEPEFWPAWEKRIAHAVDTLRPLTDTDIPIYAVLGNHDYGMSSNSAVALSAVARSVAEALTHAGVTVLQNTAEPLESPDGADAGPHEAKSTLWLGGIGPVYPNLADVAATLDAIPGDAPRIVLMHNPKAFEDVPANAAPLALAGHTHGGQIRFPWLPFWSWLELVRPGEVHADGWISTDYGAAGNRLYVNRGIGFSVLPVRINCPPEVTWFRLTHSTPSPEADQE